MAKYLTQDNLCDPLSKNARGENCSLNDAALKGAFEVVKYFISELKCNPNSAGEMGRVPIHLAAQGGHMDLVKYLTEECHCDTEPLDDDHMTPLHLASIFGHLDVVKYLVYDRHCNPTIQDSYAFTPPSLCSKGMVILMLLNISLLLANAHSMLKNTVVIRH